MEESELRAVSRQLLSDFEDYLENEAQLSGATCEVYAREAGFLLSWLGEHGLDVSTVTIKKLDEYMAGREEELDARTLAPISPSPRRFFSFLVQEESRADHIALLI